MKLWRRRTQWQRDHEWLETHHIDVAYDREGNAYTTHVFAQDGDPWIGARILSATCVRQLRETDDWPLREKP